MADDACKLYIWMFYYVQTFENLQEMYFKLSNFNYSVWSTSFEYVMSSVPLFCSVLFIVIYLVGSNYYVRILSTIDRELLKPNASVALHKHSNALVDVLPPEADSSIMMLTSGKHSVPVLISPPQRQIDTISVSEVCMYACCWESFCKRHCIWTFVSWTPFLFSDQKPDVMYADIGGMDIQKQEVREAVELPLTHFELYKQVRYSKEMWHCCVMDMNFALTCVGTFINLENQCEIFNNSGLFPFSDRHWPTQGCPHVRTSRLW